MNQTNLIQYGYSLAGLDTRQLEPKEDGAVILVLLIVAIVLAANFFTRKKD